MSGIDLLALIGRDTALKRVASTNGGEYAVPCPLPGCGGGVDRLRVWPNHSSGRGRWWCRQCDRKGDAITYVRERDGLDYREAMQALGLEAHQEARRGGKGRERRRNPTPAASREADPPTWDPAAALAVVGALERDLWVEVGAKARAWLARRGIREETARAWRLGYNVGTRSIAGLVVPRGIAIPCFVGGAGAAVRVQAAAAGNRGGCACLDGRGDTERQRARRGRAGDGQTCCTLATVLVLSASLP